MATLSPRDAAPIRLELPYSLSRRGVEDYVAEKAADPPDRFTLDIEFTELDKELRRRAFKIYENAIPKENLVHSMEHGAVIVWYNTENQQVIDQIKSVVQAELDRRKLVVMSPYTEIEPDTIALTAWTYLDAFDEFDLTRITKFIQVFQCRYNQEHFCK